MILIFISYYAQEISSSAYREFFSTFRYQSKESDSDFNSDTSDSDLSDFDSDIFGCGQITPEVESMVENNLEICKLFDEVYFTTTSELIKETINLATDETQCARLKFFKDTTPCEDRNLIETCTKIFF